MVSNSQRLAHPYKVQRKASNQKKKEQLQAEIERHMKYINNSTQTEPTCHCYCYTHNHLNDLANYSTQSFRPYTDQRPEMGELHAQPRAESIRRKIRHVDNPNMVKHGVLTTTRDHFLREKGQPTTQK
jgi:hypothetical protein